MSFAVTAAAQYLRIYETYAAGFVEQVELIYYAGSVVVFDGIDSTACGEALEIALDGTIVTKTVKITTRQFGYEQIDAVQLCGPEAAAPPFFPPPPSPPSVPTCSEPLDLVLVFDHSSSVGGELGPMREFARGIVETFEMDESAVRAGLVTFETTVQTRMELGYNKTKLLEEIDSIGLGSKTFLSGGLAAAQAVIEGAPPREVTATAVYLLGDGVQTVGGNDATAIAAADTLKEQTGAVIAAWGFGDVSQQTLERIATAEPYMFYFSSFARVDARTLVYEVCIVCPIYLLAASLVRTRTPMC